MEDSSLARPAPSVVCYVAAACPSAWTTSRWPREVERLRPVDPRFRVMSRSVLNEHRELPPGYRECNDRARGPARVCTAAAAQHGDVVPRESYTALGERIHVRREPDYDTVVAGALDELALPAPLAKAAATEGFDESLRASHRAAQDAVGEAAGTPIVALDGTAFFGPVLSAVPKDEAAVLGLFDAVRTLAGTGAFAELERGRDALDLG